MVVTGRSAPVRAQRTRLAVRWRRWFDGSVAQELVARLRELSFGTTITMFGASFLLSALPLIILMNSFANRRTEDDLTHHLGLNAQAAQIVDQLFDNSGQRSTSAIVIGVLLALAGSIAIAGSVQGVYEQVFGRSRHPTGNLVRLLLWVAALFGWFACDAVFSAATSDLPGGEAIAGLMVFAATVAFFGWSMHFLLSGTRPWHDVALPAVLTAVFWIALELFAAAFFSSTITSDSRLYGTVGVVFSLLTWFIAIAAVIVLGAVIGDVWQRRRRERHGAVRD